VKKCLFVLSAGLLAAQAHAGPITFTGNSGSYAASAEFSVSGGNLLVKLTNSSTADVLVPADVLTSVFFRIAGNPALTPVSALLTAGSSVIFGPDGGGNVGGEWAYASGLAGAPGGANAGISSSGLGLFGSGNFNGVNLQGPIAVNGMQYGIVSAGDNSATGNEPVTGTNAFIKNSVEFTLSGLLPGFDPSVAISNVSFQYGTALLEANVPGVPVVLDGPGPGGNVLPVPGGLPLLGTAVLALGFIRRRRPA
jgi:hypothetical protein